ncbi:MAG: rhomboid family intramembrane serine protease, partial [Abditibacteriales bacterium]|nr:rhomboid family intramembrane serine protease [Abditibacteriales bacterium]MDW8366728.1 rhomboid family intramembrane serine protease [Abditibacteriales bacterium]
SRSGCHCERSEATLSAGDCFAALTMTTTVVMILPIADDNSDRTSPPIVTYVLIALNVFVFAFLQGMGSNDKFTYAFSTVPQEILTGQDVVTSDRWIQDPLSGRVFRVPGLQPTPISVYITLLTSMFMHGGIAHLAGNMLFLWVFGDNVENALGRVRFIVFYLLCGVLASLAHVYTTAESRGNLLIPSLGASGAISGVLGAYLLLFPQKRVVVILLRFFTEVPAIVAIGVWFLFQVINGIGMLGLGSRAGGGVAYAAHIGGFIAGLALVMFFAGKQPQRQRRPQRAWWAD